MSRTQSYRGRGSYRGNNREQSRGGRGNGQRDKGSQGYYQRRSYHDHEADEENFTFEVNPNKVDTVKFTNAKRKLVSFVGTRYPDVSDIFEHNIDKVHEYPIAPVFKKGEDPHNFLKGQHKKCVELIMKREDEYKENKKLTYALLWKHCSTQLQNLIRAIEDFEDMDKKKDVVRLWSEVKKQCTVGTAAKADPEQISRDADKRFQNFHQFPTETVSTFFDRFMQECEAWMQAGNAFVEMEFISPNDDPVDINDPRVKEATARVQEKSNKRQAMLFLNKLDRNKFTGLHDSLANDLNKGNNNYPNNVGEAMLLAQNYREDGRVIGDYVSGKEHHNSAYSTFEYNKEYQNRKRKYDGSDDEGSEDSNKSGEINKKNRFKNNKNKRNKEQKKNKNNKNKKYGRSSEKKVKCYFCNKEGHIKDECPLLVKAAKLLKYKQDNLRGGKQEDKKESTMNKALHVLYDDAERRRIRR